MKASTSSSMEGARMADRAPKRGAGRMSLLDAPPPPQTPPAPRSTPTPRSSPANALKTPLLLQPPQPKWGFGPAPLQPPPPPTDHCGEDPGFPCCASRMRPRTADDGFRASRKSPRCITARWISGVLPLKASAARSSTPPSSIKASNSCSSLLGWFHALAFCAPRNPQPPHPPPPPYDSPGPLAPPPPAQPPHLSTLFQAPLPCTCQ
mmetsp:Transcript_118659/g.236362  ORF Transcript_118659/g.236362 Transcript_118659/m.236362 type:complete len:207 (-) Transcript_118659:604-1224(-)